MLRRGRSKQTFKQAPMIRRRSVLPGRVDVILFLGELPPAARLSGTKLGLRIAAGNVPNLVDLETGGLGPVIQDPLNSSQTATLATVNTLANLLAVSRGSTATRATSSSRSPRLRGALHPPTR